MWKEWKNVRLKKEVPKIRQKTERSIYLWKHASICPRAVYLNMLYQLSDKLSDSQKDELEKKQPQGQEKIAEAFSNFFTQDEIGRSFESACSDVLGTEARAWRK